MIFIEVLAALVAAVSVVLPARGIVRRNAFLGVRTRATMRDEETWRRGHRAATAPTLVGASVTVGAAVPLLLIGRVNDPVWTIVLAVPIVLGAGWGAFAANRAVR